MSLTRSAGMMMLVAAAMLLGGCQTTKEESKAFRLSKNVPPPTHFSDPEVHGDPALATRQWTPTAALFGNDQVVAGPTYTPLDVTRMKYGMNAIFEPLLFVGNTLYTPFGCFVEAPWSNVLYKSIVAEPSYTLMPPLPNGPAKAPVY